MIFFIIKLPFYTCAMGMGTGVARLRIQVQHGYGYGHASNTATDMPGVQLQA